MEITIGLHSYNIPYNWNELTIKDGIKLYNFCSNNIPKGLIRKYDIMLNSNDFDNDIAEWEENITEEDNELFLKFIDKTINYFTKAPFEDLEVTSEESKINVYSTYLERYVLDILFLGVTYNPLGITKFNHKKNTYYLPSDKKIGDITIPMYDLIANQFCEVADLLALVNKGNDGFKYTPYVLAVLCLQKNEFYNEELALKRAKEFEQLPMDIVWEVFFCLIVSTHIQQKDLYSYLEAQKEIKEYPQAITLGQSSYWTYTLSRTIPFHWN